MTNADLILVILACIYAIEAGWWVRPGSLLFVSHLGLGCRLRVLYSAALLRNDHIGLMFGNFLPLGHAVLTQQWPISLSPEGVASVGCQAITDDGRPEELSLFYRWEMIESAGTEGAQLHVNGKLFARTSSQDLARHLAKLINDIRQLLDPAHREKLIHEAIQKQLDHDAFYKRYDGHLLWSMPLFIVCMFLMLYVFVVAPWQLNLFEIRNIAGNLLVYVPWLRKYLLGRRALENEYMPFGPATTDFWEILLSYGQLLGITLLTYFLVHMLLRRPRGERLGHMAMMIVSPADAIHARDSLFRNMAVAYHPLTVAKVLASTRTFTDLARHTLLDLRFPLPRHQPLSAEMATTVDWFRLELGSALEHFVAQHGLNVAELVQLPKPDSPESKTICPRCHGQYVLEAGTCTVCELPLVKLGTKPVTSWQAKPAPVVEAPKEEKVEPAKPPAAEKVSEPAPARSTAKDPPSTGSPPKPKAAARPAPRRDKRKKRRGGGSAPDRSR